MKTLQLWWGAELGQPNEWRWHADYFEREEPLSAQQWYEYHAGVPARLIERRHK